MVRGLAVVAAAALLCAVLSAFVTAGPAGASPSVAHSCKQNVAPGQFACLALKRTDLKAPKALGPAAVPVGYGRPDLVSAYKLPSSATTATVAIVDAYDDPSAESDLAAYRSQYGLSACTTANGCFKKVNQNGATSPLPAGNTGWAQEIALDLDMVSAVCPSCHILLIEANDAFDNNLFAAVDRARLMGARYVSMSWGGAETGSENSDDSLFNHPGVVYTASSGDDGYGAEYPSTSQYVVSVGGTSLNRATGTTRGWTESAWSGAGSGCSSTVTKPAFQSGISACTKRADTDVSAVADPATGVAVYAQGGWHVFGGTSVSAPIIAAVYALAGTPGASDRPGSYPYSHTTNLFDVTSGSNGSCSPSLLCHGVAGWDGPTGIGTPNGTAGFKAANTVTVTSPGAPASTVGASVSLQIHATDSATGQTLTYTTTGLPPGLTINSATGLVSGSPTTAGTYQVTAKATDSTQAAGSTTFAWTIGSTPGAFASLPPARVLDTRTGTGAPAAPIGGGKSISVQITGRGGVPSSGVSAVAVAVTATQPATTGFLTSQGATIVNFRAGQNITDLAVLPVDSAGKVTFTNGSGSTLHVVADLTGYYFAGTPSAAGAFAPLPAARVLDTRTGIGAPGPVAARQSVTVQITGSGSVPSTAVSAVAVAVTVVSPAADGYLTAQAGGPAATIVNFRAGQGITAVMLLPVTSDGKITFTNNSGSTIHLVGDVTGSFVAGTPSARGTFAPVALTRIFDTRKGIPQGAVAAGRTVSIKITASNGIPATVTAVAVAVTVTQPAAPGWLTAKASGPAATVINFSAGQSITDLVLMPVDSTGGITFTNNSSSTIQLVGDLTGYCVG